MGRMFMCAACVVLLAGCSSVDVTTDYDRQADFSQFASYDWLPAPDQIRARGGGNPLMRTRIERAVNEHLSAKGMNEDTLSPDLLVAIHTGMKDRLDVDTWGYSYGRRGRLHATDVDVRQY